MTPAERERRSTNMRAMNHPRPPEPLPVPGTFWTRPFRGNDIEELGPWLVERLKVRWTHLHERQIGGWLQAAIGVRGFLFIRSEKAVALAQATNKLMQPQQVVEEVFVLAREGGIEEAALLYREFKHWADALGADEVICENLTDVPHDLIKAQFGRLWARDQVFYSKTLAKAPPK